MLDPVAPTAIALAFGNADQAIFREMRDKFDWLMVPGTIATYFREATGGFVLSLGRPYAIDPRTPVLQYRIPFDEVRSSHRTLAAEYGDAFLARLESEERKVPNEDEWIDASRGITVFQRDYATTSASRLAKYASLLGEEPQPAGAPQFLLPGYLMVDSAGLEDWPLTLRMLDAARGVANGREVVPVAALRSTNASRPDLDALEKMLSDLRDKGEHRAFVWMNAFDERRAEAAVIRDIGVMLRKFPGMELFNMYGGFLSVAMGVFRTVASGVGYSESRDATQLFATGAVPARYYHPALHAFLNPDLAALVAEKGGAQMACSCPICGAGGTGSSLPRLSHKQLLLHFVHVRAMEKVLAGAGLQAVIDQLDGVAAAAAALQPQLPPRLPVPTAHLHSWSAGLKALRDS